MMSKKEKIIIFIILHLILLLYSVTGIFGKLASAEDFLSLRFCFFYGLIIFFLGIYAICWQQIIKRMPITLAFANKAVTTIWGTVFGTVIFKDSINSYKIIGTFLIAIGIVIFSTERESPNEQ